MAQVLRGFPGQDRVQKQSSISDYGFFANVIPTGYDQAALTISGDLFVELVGSDTAEANTDVSKIVASSHAAKKGDVVRITSGDYSDYYFPVVETDTNDIFIGTKLAAAISTGVTFQIYKYTKPVVNASGELVTTSSSSGLSSRGFALNDNSSTAISTSYVELIASTSGLVKKVYIADTAGEPTYLAVGAAASEVDVAVVPPGGITLDLEIASGARVSVKRAGSTDLTSGRYYINTLG